MAGVYVHIPFCKRRCFYCDFFSTTLLERIEEYTQALLKEISVRKDETGEAIKTIYFGGGTPSILPAAKLARILRAIGRQDAEEITIEMNPGDAKPEYLHELREAGFNRLSIGIQSFQNELLYLIGRRHNSEQALIAVQKAKEAGFDNISIDLMYALPTQTLMQWEADIETALSLEIQHISSYGLMYEDGTQLTRLRESGQIKPIDEDTENNMYDLLCSRLKQAGYEHYEVSNFSLPEYKSKHNSNYWNHTPYIGIGAGAHSLVRNERSWNPDDLEAYIQGIKDGSLEREKEKLSERDLYNERIMLGLRTSNGCTLPPSASCRETVELYKELDLLSEPEAGRIVATQKGLHVLNRIIEGLMMESEE